MPASPSAAALAAVAGAGLATAIAAWWLRKRERKAACCGTTDHHAARAAVAAAYEATVKGEARCCVTAPGIGSIASLSLPGLRCASAASHRTCRRDPRAQTRRSAPASATRRPRRPSGLRPALIWGWAAARPYSSRLLRRARRCATSARALASTSSSLPSPLVRLVGSSALTWCQQCSRRRGQRRRRLGWATW